MNDSTLRTELDAMVNDAIVRSAHETGKYMNRFNRKYICTVFVFLCAATMLEAEQSSLKGQNPFKDLIDNNLEGFFLSGGVGYRIGQAEVSKHDIFLRHSSVQIQWKAGYVTSRRLGVYLTSAHTLENRAPIRRDVSTAFTPKLGVMWYLGRMSRSPRRYLQALIEFSEGAFYSGGVVQSLEGGFGYEFRPHFVFDVAAGYNRLLVQFYDGKRDVGHTLVDTNELTLVVSLNYRFY